MRVRGGWRWVAAAVLVAGAAACSDSPGSGFPGGSAATPSAPGATATGPGPAPTGSITPPPAAVVRGAPPLPTGATVAAPKTIAGDCSVDVTDALASWIASVPDNSTLVLGRNACYRVDGTITVENRNRLLLDGNGATLKAVTTGNRTRGQLNLKSGSDLTVRALVVRGANPHAGASTAAYVADLEAQHAFSVHGVANALLDHVQAYDTYGDFVYIGPYDKTASTNVTVANSVFERSGRQGVSIADARGVTITANVIAGAARSLFDIEPFLKSQTVRDVHVDGNVTGAAVNFWLGNKGAAADIGAIEFSHNRMAAATGGLVLVFARRGDPRGPYTFSDNDLIANDAVSDEGAVGAFFFGRADGITVRDNTVRFPAGHHMPAVELHAVHGATVTGNRFDGADRAIVADNLSSDIHGP